MASRFFQATEMSPQKRRKAELWRFSTPSPAFLWCYFVCQISETQWHIRSSSLTSAWPPFCRWSLWREKTKREQLKLKYFIINSEFSPIHFRYMCCAMVHKERRPRRQRSRSRRAYARSFAMTNMNASVANTYNMMNATFAGTAATKDMFPNNSNIHTASLPATPTLPLKHFGRSWEQRWFWQFVKKLRIKKIK